MKRVDAGDFGVVGAALPLFDGPKQGDEDLFAASKVMPAPLERVVAGMIAAHKGQGNPLPIARIAAAIGRDERTVKGIVEQLVVTHGLRIGGRRQDPVGYYTIVDAADLEAACAPLESQIFAMWRRVRRLRSPEYLARLRGQLRLMEEEGDVSAADVAGGDGVGDAR